MQKNHYVYRSYEPLGRSYIGCRSCSCAIEEDPYMGSYKDKTFDPTQKEILAVCDTREEAMRTEMFFHEMYDVAKNPMFANRAKQTSTGFSREGTTTSEEIKQKISKSMSEAASGEKNGMFGKTHSNETKQKLHEASAGENNGMFGKKHSKETRQKISKLTSEAVSGEKHPMFGKKHSEESKQKMREAKAGENHPMFGKKWWVNSAGKTAQAKESPGPGWQQGRKFKEEN